MALFALAFAMGRVVAQTEKVGPMQSGQHVKPAPSTPAPAPVASPTTQGAGDVNKLFATSCGWCHFGGGRHAGKGPKLMDSELSDGEIVSKIRNGKIGQMPAFKDQLSEEQIKAIVGYIRGLKPQ